MKSVARFLMFLLLLLVISAGFLFAVNNTAQVPLWLGTALAPRPVAAWILLAFGSGAFAGLVSGFGLWRRIKLGIHIAMLRRRLDTAERELFLLRKQPEHAARRRPESP